MSSIILPLTRGISLGAGMTDIKRMEDSVGLGRNGMMMAASQTMQFHFSTIMVEEALSTAGLMQVPFEGYLVGYLAPSLLAIFISMEIGSAWIRDPLILLQDSIGAVCQLAALVSAVAMIAFGQLALGIASAAIISIGFLERLGVLPEWIKHPYQDHSPIVRAAASLLIGGVVEKLFALLSLVMFCFDKYVNYIAAPAEIDANLGTQNQPLNLTLLDQILTGEVELEVNPHHISLDLLTPAPEIEIAGLMTLFDRLPWENHLDVIRAKFAQDLRFTQLCGNAEECTDAKIIAHVKTNLQKYIGSIVRRHMGGGEIRDYNRLESYLKTITFQLQHEEEFVQIDALLRLAVEGGGYCGPEKFHVTEHLYCQLALKCAEISPEKKMLLRLQDCRTNWFQAEYHKRIQNHREEDSYLFKLLKMSRDFEDLHMYHIILNFYGKKLGVRKSSSDNDYAAVVDPLTQLAFQYFTSSIVDDFNDAYTVDFICEHLQSGTGTSEMPKLDLYNWWKGWVNRQAITPERKEELLDEIDYAKLLDKPMESDDPKNPLFEIPFLKAMAFDLGILRRVRAT